MLESLLCMKLESPPTRRYHGSALPVLKSTDTLQAILGLAAEQVGNSFNRWKPRSRPLQRAANSLASRSSERVLANDGMRYSRKAGLDHPALRKIDSLFEACQLTEPHN